MSLSFQTFLQSSFLAREVATPEPEEHLCEECAALEEEEDYSYAAAEELHAIYCGDSTCQWEGEEENLPDERVGVEHQKWLRIAERVKRAGIDLDDAVEAYSEVASLSRG